MGHVGPAHPTIPYPTTGPLRGGTTRSERARVRRKPPFVGWVYPKGHASPKGGACVVGASAPYNHGLPLAGVTQQNPAYAAEAPTLFHPVRDQRCRVTLCSCPRRGNPTYETCADAYARREKGLWVPNRTKHYTSTPSNKFFPMEKWTFPAVVGWASPTSGVQRCPVWWAMPTLQNPTAGGDTEILI